MEKIHRVITLTSITLTLEAEKESFLLPMEHGVMQSVVSVKQHLDLGDILHWKCCVVCIDKPRDILFGGVGVQQNQEIAVPYPEVLHL